MENLSVKEALASSKPLKISWKSGSLGRLTTVTVYDFDKWLRRASGDLSPLVDSFTSPADIQAMLSGFDDDEAPPALHEALQRNVWPALITMDCMDALWPADYSWHEAEFEELMNDCRDVQIDEIDERE